MYIYIHLIQCMYIYTCACVYIFTYIYYMCMWADNDVPTDQLKEQTKHLWSDNSREWWHLCQVCPCAYTCIYMYVCVHIYMLLYVRVYTCLMTSVSGLSMCVYMYIYVCMCTYIHVIVCACVYMFIYRVCLCACIYIYIYIYVYIYIHICLCVCVCIHVYIYTLYTNAQADNDQLINNKKKRFTRDLKNRQRGWWHPCQVCLGAHGGSACRL